MTYTLVALVAFVLGVLRGCLTAKREIWTVCGEAVYLERWYLLGGKREETDNPRPVALFLHRMLLPDPDRDMHDHPWSFLTLVLWGGYIEEYADTSGNRHLRFVRPMTVNWRPAEHTHRIASLPKGRALTLVLRMRRRRKWGFHTALGWVPWRRHIAIRKSAVCGED